MPIKSVKMKISKNKKMRFFLMSQGSLDPKIRFIGQKVCSVARVQTDRHTDRQTHRQTRKWIQRTPFQGFRNFSFNLSSRIGPIFSKHYVPMPKTMYMRWKIRLFFLIHYKRENLVHAKKTQLIQYKYMCFMFP